LCPADLRWQWLDDTALQLSFSLPPGAYATVVLAELGDMNTLMGG
jgi:tRNA pseudouridine13 synthase